MAPPALSSLDDEVAGVESERWLAWKAAVRLPDQKLPRPYSEISSIESAEAAQIEKDIRRTFPELEAFDVDQEQRLSRVLNAYAVHDPSVGYCQGMNYVAAILLMQSESEEDAFGILVKLMENHGLSGFYCDGLPLLRRYEHAFSCLMAQEAPKLWRHLEEQGIIPCLYLHEWFLTLFINCLPLSVVVVIWDAIMSQGLPILLPVASSILRTLEDSVLSMQFADIFALLKAPAADARLVERLPAEVQGMTVPRSVLQLLDNCNPDGLQRVGWLQSLSRKLKSLSPRKRRVAQAAPAARERRGLFQSLSPRKRRGPPKHKAELEKDHGHVELVNVRASLSENHVQPPSPAAAAHAPESPRRPRIVQVLAALSPTRKQRGRVVKDEWVDSIVPGPSDEALVASSMPSVPDDGPGPIGPRPSAEASTWRRLRLRPALSRSSSRRMGCSESPPKRRCSTPGPVRWDSSCSPSRRVVQVRI